MTVDLELDNDWKSLASLASWQFFVTNPPNCKTCDYVQMLFTSCLMANLQKNHATAEVLSLNLERFVKLPMPDQIHTAVLVRDPGIRLF